MSFLKRRISVSVWELLVLLVLAIAFATAYRLYFSRAVTLTQVCERFETMQNSETADMFAKLEGRRSGLRSRKSTASARSGDRCRQ